MCFTVTKNASQLEKWLTVRKMRHRQQKGDKYVTVKKVGPSQKNKSKVRKVCHSQKNGSQLEKCDKVSKMGQSQKNGLLLENCVTVNKMWHKNLSQLEKWVTVGKLCLLRTEVFKYYAYSVVVPNAYLDTILPKTNFFNYVLD